MKILPILFFVGIVYFGLILKYSFLYFIILAISDLCFKLLKIEVKIVFLTSYFNY